MDRDRNQRGYSRGSGGDKEGQYERLFSWIEKGSTRGFSRGERRVIREIILVDRDRNTRGYSRGSGGEREGQYERLFLWIEKGSTRGFSRGERRVVREIILVDKERQYEKFFSWREKGSARDYSRGQRQEYERLFSSIGWRERDKFIRTWLKFICNMSGTCPVSSDFYPCKYFRSEINSYLSGSCLNCRTTNYFL